MYKKFARGMSALAVSAMLLGAEPIQACCLTDWCSCFKSKPVSPPPAPACAVCPQQISYIPQTSYRSECACVPCTTCQPVSTCCQPACACNPCGGAQTVMQPVTSFVRRPVMVPYTTMRPVVTPISYAAPACTTCGAAYSSPYYTGYSAPAMAAPSTGFATYGGEAGVSYAAPTAATVPVAATSSAAMYSPQPYATTQSYAAPSYAGQPAMAAPSYASQPGMAAPPYTSQPTMAAPLNGQPGMAAPSLGSPTPATSPTVTEHVPAEQYRAAKQSTADADDANSGHQLRQHAALAGSAEPDDFDSNHGTGLRDACFVQHRGPRQCVPFGGLPHDNQLDVAERRLDRCEQQR